MVDTAQVISGVVSTFNPGTSPIVLAAAGAGGALLWRGLKVVADRTKVQWDNKALDFLGRLFFGGK